MATAKLETFKDKDVQLALWLKALSHPARIAIMKTLADKKECICGDLVLDLPLAQSTVSQHLKALKELGLIKGEIEGLRSKYCIHKENFARFRKSFAAFQASIENGLKDIKC